MAGLGALKGRIKLRNKRWGITARRKRNIRRKMQQRRGA